jgi:hypothetical protein
MRITRNRAVLCLLTACSFFALSVNNVYGQAATASISGRIADPTGAGIPDASVTIKNTETSATQKVNTDSQGRYAAPDLAIGTYDLSASKMGFQTSVRSESI